MLCQAVWLLNVDIWKWIFSSIWDYGSDYSESVLPQVLDLFSFNDYFLVYHPTTIPLTHLLNIILRHTA